jgi:hypothetical protein
MIGVSEVKEKCIFPVFEILQYERFFQAEFAPEFLNCGFAETEFLSEQVCERISRHDSRDEEVERENDEECDQVSQNFLL